MTAYSLNKVYDIAKKLSLPNWWVLSVIIEYFDCRQYAENGRVWTFDFDKPSYQDIKAIPEKMVVIPGYIITQNILPGDLSVRASLHNGGLPVVTLEDANLIPEGLVNTTGFPGIKYSIIQHDPKLAFANNAVVRDDKFFYQWDIGRIVDHYKHKDDPLDSSEFFEIINRLVKCQSLLKSKQSDQQLKEDIENTYKELERVREKLRQKILDYHEDKKTDYNTLQARVKPPPTSFYIDSIRPTKKGYEIKTHMAPVFLRSAIRNLHNAEEAKKRVDSNPDDYNAPVDELEYSAMCIISAASCLEEYINYVINEYLPDKSKILYDGPDHREKWLRVPSALNLQCGFKAGKEPYRSFSFLVRWRNNAIHHKAKYTRVRGKISHTYNQLNVKNAEIAVKAIHGMVTKLSEDGKIPLPVWIKADMGSAPFWDEVSNYLKKL